MSTSAARRSFPGVLGWLLLLIVGQAAALALIEAGTRVSYQHYRLTWGSATSWVATGVLLVQALLVARALGPLWPVLSRWMTTALSPVARVALIGAFAITSATASKAPGLYAAELVVATLVQLVAIGNVIVLARAISGAAADARAERWFGKPGTAGATRGVDPLALTCALWVLVASAALAYWSYERHPHVPDEVVYLLQARYLAAGHLTMPLPPAPLAFNIDLMYYDATRWFSPVPPGWPFVLAIGAWLGVPWLVNPVLGAVNILLAHRLLSQVHERRVARLATLFLAVSPWFVFMAMNFMTHQLTLCFALLGALAVARVRGDRSTLGHVRGSTMGAAVFGGIAIGGASLVRPLEGLATALLLGLWSLPPRWWASLARPLVFVPSALLAAGAALGGAVVRPYNRYLTGDPSYFPIMAYIDKYYAKGSNDLGFGANRGLGWSGLDPFPGHGPIDVVVNANLNVTVTNVELLGWATGSLVAILLLVCLRRLRREDRWHLTVIGVIAGIHSFYWFSGGPDFGARYWFLIIVSCVALVARGLVELGDRLAVTAEPPGASVRGRVVMVGLALSLAALVTFFPWRAVDKYHHYRNMRPDIRELATAQHFGRSLVFIRGRRHPDFASAVIYNPIDLNAAAPLYAWDVTPEARVQALEAYADRPVWFIDGPTRTGDGFRVIAGPLSAAQARAFAAP
ncbi:MAG: hypothetical protein IT361_01140 [Gemmatimonadaceae bacterium]|nr:hypothetical protein [Gemmatimonadaceae bacterium]